MATWKPVLFMRKRSLLGPIIGRHSGVNHHGLALSRSVGGFIGRAAQVTQGWTDGINCDGLNIYLMTVSQIDGGADSGKDDNEGSLDLVDYKNLNVLRLMSFGANTCRLDLGTGSELLPGFSGVDIDFIDLGLTGSLVDATGSGYSYGGIITGIQAALLPLRGATTLVTLKAKTPVTQNVTSNGVQVVNNSVNVVYTT